MRATRLPAAALVLALLAPEAAPGMTAEELNAEGVAHFQRREYGEAERRFREALSHDAASPAARRNLAVTLQTRAQEDMRAGRWEEARDRMGRALDLEPDPSGHFLLGMIQYRLGDLYEARLQVDRALALAPAHLAARELSGDLWYQEGALERALAEWEAALPGAAPRTEALREKIARARREAAAEPGFARDVSRHFTVQYDGPVPPEVAREALRLLEEAYDRLWRDFGRAPRNDLPVILYSRALFADITRGPAWAAGAYDGKIRVPVGGLRTAAEAERLRPVLAHELAHAFIRANATARLPLWFEEGLAAACEGRDEAAARAELGRRRAFASLAEVEAALRGGDADAGPGYAAALLAVRALLGRDGFWLARRLLDAADAGVPFWEAVSRETGLTAGEFEERWRERLQ